MQDFFRQVKYLSFIIRRLLKFLTKNSILLGGSLSKMVGFVDFVNGENSIFKYKKCNYLSALESFINLTLIS